MSHRPIAYNLVRLIMSSIHTTPRGVDRIDFGYLSYLLENWPADVVGVMPTAIGFRCFSREQVMRGRTRLMGLWQEDVDAEHDRALARLIERFDTLAAADPPAKPRGFLPDIAGLRRMAHLALADGITFGKPVDDMPAQAIYLDIGHYGLTFPGTFRWRARRPDVSPVFLIHDAIPLELPQMVAAETVRAHRKLMGIVADHAQALITPTRAAGVAINAALETAGAAPVPTHPVHLPIDDLFNPSLVPIPQLAGRRYFVVCGAVEPRKNHSVLFDVWRTLIETMGEAAPYLVIAGSPGHASGAILAPLKDEPSLRRRIVLASGMASPALARVIAGARAVLMPSLAEGFGLPPIEALASGVPAVLSDIPAHREGAGVFGCFLPPGDRQAWRHAVEQLLDDNHRAAEVQRIADFRPNRWADHMGRVSEVLQAIKA
jgi:glycosyltransferase involved in cell wall biosynthesis